MAEQAALQVSRLTNECIALPMTMNILFQTALSLSAKPGDADVIWCCLSTCGQISLVKKKKETYMYKINVPPQVSLGGGDLLQPLLQHEELGQVALLRLRGLLLVVSSETLHFLPVSLLQPELLLLILRSELPQFLHDVGRWGTGPLLCTQPKRKELEIVARLFVCVHTTDIILCLIYVAQGFSVAYVKEKCQLTKHFKRDDVKKDVKA